ncbi:MAG: hypothetical protein R3Y24_13065 [Eubacteriales bacterium]
MKKSNKVSRQEVTQYQQEMNRLLKNIDKRIIQQDEMREKLYLEIFEDIERQKRTKAKRSKRLEDEILRISSNCNSVVASQLLSPSTATIGKSTICSLLKKEAPLLNKSSITRGCIDDFAIKKRKK